MFQFHVTRLCCQWLARVVQAFLFFSFLFSSFLFWGWARYFRDLLAATTFSRYFRGSLLSEFYGILLDNIHLSRKDCLLSIELHF